MTEQQKDLIRSSFAAIAPNVGAVAARFYARLFELDPNLRPLFQGDMQAQGRKLMAMDRNRRRQH
jgi:hemoglobin-like flavoprotein